MPKETDRPKRALGPYNFFIKDRRSHYKANNMSISFISFSKECSGIWKSLTNEEKEKYSKNADDDKARFRAEMATYEPVVSSKAKKRKTTKDPNQPKRPLPGFFYFCNEERPRYRSEKPGTSLAELSKKLGAHWRLLTDEEKAPFILDAQKDKERYEKEMELFRNISSSSSSSSKKKGAKSNELELEPDSSSSED